MTVEDLGAVLFGKAKAELCAIAVEAHEFALLFAHFLKYKMEVNSLNQY